MSFGREKGEEAGGKSVERGDPHGSKESVYLGSGAEKQSIEGALNVKLGRKYVYSRRHPDKSG